MELTLEAFQVRVCAFMRERDRASGTRVFKTACPKAHVLRWTRLEAVDLRALFPQYAQAIVPSFEPLAPASALTHGLMRGASGLMVVFVARQRTLVQGRRDLDLCLMQRVNGRYSPYESASGATPVPCALARMPPEALDSTDACAQLHVIGVPLRVCANCFAPSTVRRALRKCARCRVSGVDVWYCDADCQRAHWYAGHARVCV